jgi:hypothetical protein
MMSLYNVILIICIALVGTNIWEQHQEFRERCVSSQSSFYSVIIKICLEIVLVVAVAGGYAKYR